MSYKSKMRAYLRAFDLRTYLKEHDQTPQVHGGEWAIDCPGCSAIGKNKKLWVQVDDKVDKGRPKRAGNWICYYCGDGGGDVLSLIRWLEDCTLFRAVEVLTTYRIEGRKVADLRMLVQDTLFGVAEIEPTWDDVELPEMALPAGFERARKPLHPYLRERGISVKRARKFGLGIIPTATPSKLRNRLVVPVQMHGRTVLWVARYMRARPPAGVKKTLYPYGGKPGRVLFNYDEAQTAHVLYLVEDVFSAMHMSEGLREGEGVMATLGTSLSQYQMELLLKTDADEIVILWDLDPDAKPGQSGYEKAIKLAGRLCEFWRVRVPKLPDTRDPDELTHKHRRKIVRRARVMDESTAWKVAARDRLARG